MDNDCRLLRPVVVCPILIDLQMYMICLTIVGAETNDRSVDRTSRLWRCSPGKRKTKTKEEARVSGRPSTTTQKRIQVTFFGA